MTKHDDISKQVDQLYRQYGGQLISACSSYFGMINLAIAEDVVQDTFVAALSSWGEQGVPHNPKAWLYKVCKNKSLNLLAKRQKEPLAIGDPSRDQNIDQFFLDHEIQDQQLRWLFATAIPSFSPRMRMVFMLKTIHGIRVRDISELLLVKEASIQKMYERARAQISSDLEKTTVPEVSASKERLPSIINALYLIYTLGYDQPWQADSGEDLCYDALRLTKSLIDKPTYQTPTLYALYSLMLFQTARLPARISSDGVLRDLQQQDRTKWDVQLVRLGIAELNKSQTKEYLSKYHLEATIASLHCTAKSWSGTPWPSILKLYLRLERVAPSPFVKLNLCIALLYAEGHQSALHYLQTNHFSVFSKSYLYHATLSRIYEIAQIQAKARYHLSLAISCAHDPPVKHYFQQRLDAITAKQ